MKNLFILILHNEGSSCAWIPTFERPLEEVIKHNIKTYNKRLEHPSALNSNWWDRNSRLYSEFLPLDFIYYCSRCLPYPLYKLDEKVPTIF